MEILVAAATRMEIEWLAARMHIAREEPPVRSGDYRGHAVDLLVTGVGMVATAAWCGRVLSKKHYDLAFNFGVCGSFDASLAPGAVVHVVADHMPELGAEDGRSFLTIQELHLLGRDEFPYTDGHLVNTAPPANPVLHTLPAVNGITVNTVHGNATSIATVAARFGPAVETMEGAAFMYSCLIAGVPFAQVRAVSNVVETRNREAWNMAGALDSLGRTMLGIFDRL